MSTLISRRENQILNMIAYEFSSKEIAARLYIARETVHSHRKNLLKKLEVINSAGMVRKGIELGLIQQPNMSN